MTAEIPNGRRAPPCFQVYAASRLADRNQKLFKPAEYGLRYHMELECWVNGNVPSNLGDLARVLGWNASDVEEALTDRVMHYFERRDGVIISPELEAYRAELDRHYSNRAEAGRRNIALVNERKRSSNSSSNSSSDSTSNPSSVPTGPKYSTVKTSQDQSLESGVIPEEHRDFVTALGDEPPFMTEKKMGARIKPGMGDR